ncbi:MAG: L,D-transpeptidase [Pseudomonadota bacterium]
MSRFFMPTMIGSRIAMVGGMCLAAAITVTGHAAPAQADASWSNGAPVFRSDVQRRQKRMAAARAERRKSYSPVRYPRYMKGGGRPKITPEAPPIVYLTRDVKPGQVIIDTQGRRLFYTLSDNRAYAYPISVGRQGFTWTGKKKITRKANWPSWTPPAEMRRRQPGLPVTVSGGVKNPLGAKALYLGSTLYRIHGTNNPRTIGRASSSGCFRLMNKHVVHLASLTKVGTTVHVMRSFDDVSEMPSLARLLGL